MFAPGVPPGLVVERNRILAEAKKLKEAADFLCMAEEVADLIFPQVERKPGRQPGSRSQKVATISSALWKAYEEEKTRSPATEDVIAQRLYERKLGQSRGAIKQRIIKLKRANMSLLELASNERRGRPRKTEK
jgi:hypothetical protein